MVIMEANMAANGKTADGNGHVANGNGHLANGNGHLANGNGHLANGVQSNAGKANPGYIQEEHDPSLL